jgi:hypothetical protein
MPRTVLIRRAPGLLVLALWPPPLVWADNKPAKKLLIIEDIYRPEAPIQPAVSPDGKRLVAGSIAGQPS